MSENSKLLVRGARFFDLPADALANLAHIEICGTSQALIEQHKGILEYNDTTLALNLGTHILTIQGRNLNISAMDEQGLRLSGDIEHLQYDPV